LGTLEWILIFLACAVFLIVAWNLEEIKRSLHSLLWWKLDLTELDKQINQYNTLSIIKSTRGQSFLLLIFSSCFTILSILFSDLPNIDFVEVFLSLLLGYFIYRGHQWAMMSAMIFWTVEKLYPLYEVYEALINFSDSNSEGLIMYLIWWALYMHIFYLAFNVERLRDSKREGIPPKFAIPTQGGH